MKHVTPTMLAASTALAIFAAPAQAATVCSLTDISPNASACVGFFDGQLLGGNSTSRAAQQAALGDLGLTINLTSALFGSLTNISGLTGAHSTTTSLMLYGDTFIGMHFGNGQGGPGNATAFYKFDAGVDGLNLNTLTWKYNASSDLIVYSTGKAPPPPAVPEPASWAMLIMGLGTVGFAMRRKAAKVSFA